MKLIKGIFTVVIVLLVVALIPVFVGSCENAVGIGDSERKTNATEKLKVTETPYSDVESEEQTLIDRFSEKHSLSVALVENIKVGLDTIGVNLEDIPRVVTLDDWIGGERYRLHSNDGNVYVVYATGDYVLNINDDKLNHLYDAPPYEGTPTDGESDGITLVYGKLGEYGETVTLDGADYINYRLPVGTYEVTSNRKQCTVYVASDNYYKNSSGYTENEIIETLVFTEAGQVQTVTIGDGEHIELTMHADVTFTLVG